MKAAKKRLRKLKSKTFEFDKDFKVGEPIKWPELTKDKRKGK